MTIRSLGWIFWGGLLCVVDVCTEHGVRTVDEAGIPHKQGFRFDYLNDVLGTLLIAIACFQLARLKVHQRYDWVLAFLRPLAVVAVLVAWDSQFVRTRSDTLLAALQVYELASMVALFLFVLAMGWLCEAMALSESVRSWRWSAWLVGGLLCLPSSALAIAGLVLASMDRSFDLQPSLMAVDVVGILLLVLSASACGHFFLSLWRTRRELRAAWALPDRARQQRRRRADPALS